MTKLCVDCKWHRKYRSNWCYHPSNGEDIINGGLNGRGCSTKRRDMGIKGIDNPDWFCKVEARFFEAIPQPKSMWTKLKELFK